MMHSSWLVNSIAGDFNPPHMHYGMLSAAGWLKMPPSVEKNEEREHAGWIEFIYGRFTFRGQRWVPHCFPQPEDTSSSIYIRMTHWFRAESF